MKKVVTTTNAKRKKKVSKKAAPPIGLQGVNPLYAALALAFIAFIAYLPSLQNDFVNWDDPSYILNNMHIRHFDFGVLIEMFNPFPKNYLVSNYHPFTELSLAIDHIIYGGLKPKGFHITNLVLHSINTALVFTFIYRLAGKSIIIAGFTALFFGIHPMHIESVAWVSERKDVLHVLFYLLAMLQYLKYLESDRTRKYLVYTFILFICSLLSKAQAVTLPLALLLLDYFYSRKDLKLIALEKAPFFVFSLLFGLLAIKAQASTEAITLVNIPLAQRPFTGSYALFTYLWMLFAPVGLSALHPYPFEMGGALPWRFYASILVMLGFLAALFFAWKKDKKEIAFGLGFFFFTILPVLQFLTVGEAIIAERYTYLPYIGLLFMLGYFIDKAFTVSSLNKFKLPLIALVTVFSVAFIVMDWDRIGDWKDSPTLWNNVLEQYPNEKLAYVNLSHFFSEVKEYDKSIEYAEKGLKIAPNHYKLWVNKAFGLMKKNQHKAAIPVLQEAVKRDPHHYEIYFNLGICHDNLKQFDKSFEYYNKTLEYEPDHIQAFLQRGVIYSNNKNDQAKAAADFKRVIEYAPTHPDGLMNLAVSYYKMQNYEEALEYATRAVDASPTNGKTYYVRSLAYNSLGKTKEAQADQAKAKSLGHNF